MAPDHCATEPVAGATAGPALYANTADPQHWGLDSSWLWRYVCQLLRRRSQPLSI